MVAPSQDNESTVVKVLKSHRARLDARDTELMEDMGKRWLQVEYNLQSDMSVLAEEMARRQREGQPVTVQMIRLSEQYKRTQDRMAAEITKYNNQYAVDRIETAQKQFASMGIDASQDAITSSFSNPLMASFDRINVNAVESMIGLAGDGSPLKSLLVEDYGDAANGVFDALVNGLARGLGPSQIASDMRNGMGMGFERSLLIARTEAARAYRTGSTKQYRESGVVNGFMRLVKKETACLGCLMLDGEIFELADELNDHPRGKCTAVPIVEGTDPPQWETGKQWLEKLPEDQQRKILGPARFELYKQGYPLDAFSSLQHNKVWGSSPIPTPLENITKVQGDKK